MITLAAHGQLAQFPDEIFPDAGVDFTEFRGSLEVQSPTPVVGMAIRTSPGEFSTLPVTPVN